MAGNGVENGIGRARKLERQVVGVIPEEAQSLANIGRIDIGNFDVKGRRYQLVYGLTGHPLRNIEDPEQPVTYGLGKNTIVSVIETREGVSTARPLAYNRDFRDLGRRAEKAIRNHLTRVKTGEVEPSWQLVRTKLKRSKPGPI